MSITISAGWRNAVARSMAGCVWSLAAVVGTFPAHEASAVDIPETARVCLPPSGSGDGLTATFVDPATIAGPDYTANAIIALDTLPQQTATVPRIAFTLRDDSENAFGPFGHDGG